MDIMVIKMKLIMILYQYKDKIILINKCMVESINSFYQYQQ